MAVLIIIISVFSGLVRTKRLALCLGILYLYKKKNHVRNQVRRQRRWWVRPVFADHDTHGAWVSLIPTMRETDRDLYYNFMRMTPECFDKLLALITPFIQKYSWRKSIPPGERLAITLRYVCTRVSFAMSYVIVFLAPFPSFVLQIYCIRRFSDVSIIPVSCLKSGHFKNFT